MPDDDSFTHAHCANTSQLNLLIQMYVEWGHRRNQVCKIFWKSVQWFMIRSRKTLKNGISHWKRPSPLQQCCATA